MEPIYSTTFIADLRKAGDNAAADGAEIVNELGPLPSPPPQRPGIIPDDVGGTHRERGPRGSSQAGTSAATATINAEGHASPQPSGSLGSTAAYADVGVATSEAPASEGHGEGHAPLLEPQTAIHKDSHGIDASDPLAGLHSERLRSSLEREAFRSADSVTQDSAIAERVLSPDARALLQRAESVHQEPLPLDISRQAQASRVAALDGTVPAWVRGDPSLDSTITRATEQARVQSPVQSQEQARVQSPTESPAPATSQSGASASSRVRDVGMER